MRNGKIGGEETSPRVWRYREPAARPARHEPRGPSVYSPDTRIDPSPWLEAGRHLSPEDGWARVRDYRTAHPRHPHCLYVHIPYCREACDFCALYRFPLGGDTPEGDDILDTYLQALLREIEIHASIKSGLEPTTIHFGGGTPLSMGTARLGILIDNLRRAFGPCKGTEWAIETTSSNITGDTLDFFTERGIKRVHVGVQSLDESIRRAIGRRETGAQVAEKLRLLMDCGFSVSVDLIIGLPLQDRKTLQTDLTTLHELGVRTFSVCELFVPSGSAQPEAEQRKLNFQLWLRLCEFMREVGLEAIHYGQFARRQEDNLYYTYPARGENCLALGTYSHGSFGNLFYGNKTMPDYVRDGLAPCGPVGFAVEYDDAAMLVRRFETRLLSNRIPVKDCDHMTSHLGPVFSALWEAWLESGLIAGGSDPAGGFAVTPAGNWYLGNMVRDLRRLA